MKQFYNVLIDKGEIIGVGPFMQKRPTDPAMAMLYREAVFQFDVYTRHYIITVSTDWLKFTPDSKDASNVEYEKIKAVWEELWRDLELGMPGV